MDYNSQQQWFYLNNPPPQLPDTSGPRRQYADGSIAHSWRLGDQNPSSLNDGSAFLQQISVSNIPTGTETLSDQVTFEALYDGSAFLQQISDSNTPTGTQTFSDQATFEALHDGSTFVGQGTSSSIQGETGDFLRFLLPLDDWSVMLRQGTGFSVPAGTRVFDQYASQPLDLAFSAQYQSAGGDLGRHDYLPQPGEQFPELYCDYFDTTTMTGILPETSMIPDDSVNAQPCFHTTEFSAQGQQPHLDGTTIGHLSTLPQFSSQAGWENNTETINGNYNIFEVMDEIPDPVYVLASDLAPEQTRHQLQREATQMALFNSSSQVGPSATQGKPPGDSGICKKRRKSPDIEHERKRFCIPGLKKSDGEVNVFKLPSDHSSERVSREKAREPRNKCGDSSGICGLCSKSRLPCIKDPLPPLTNPDITMDNKIDLSQQTGCPLLSPKTWNAIVFVCSSPYGPVVPLSCKVNSRKINGESLQKMMIQSEIWDDMLDSRDRISVDWELRASYSIPSSHMPSRKKIQQWALDSLELDATGGIGNLHEYLFPVATKYVESCNRPLHNLVSLTRKYAAIYSVCNSKLSLQLETGPHRTYQACPWLRAQICVPVLRTLGADVEKCLRKAISKYHSNNGLAISVVFWFLILMHRHSNARAKRATFLHMEANYISSEELSNTCQQLGKSLECICSLYKIWFLQTTGSVCPIFNDKLQLECGTAAQNVELQIAVRNIRTALWQYLEDAQVTDDSQDTDDLSEQCLRDLVKSIQNFRKQENPKGIQKTSQPILPASEKMVSEPDDLDFSKCYIMERARDINILLRDLGSTDDYEDYLDMDSNWGSSLTAGETSKPYDWCFGKYSIGAVEYNKDGDPLLQDLEDHMKQSITSKGKEAAVDTDCDRNCF